MRSRFATALALAGVAAGAVAIPAQAQVPDAAYERLGSGGALPSLTVKATNRYKISVTSAFGNVLLQTQRAPTHTEYVVSGTGTGKRIKANFGKFGKIDVRFKKKGKARKYRPRSCTGRAAKRQPGVWRGTIKFKGEKGYTKVNAKKARGNVIKGGDLTCDIPGITQPTVWLFAERDRPQGDLEFEAFKLRDNPSARPDFRATSRERNGKVKITRTVSLRGQPGQFTFTISPYSGVVQPPSPFKGSGTYSSSSGSWTGNLRVKFPGTNAIALTGSGFSAGMGVLP